MLIGKQNISIKKQHVWLRTLSPILRQVWTFLGNTGFLDDNELVTISLWRQRTRHHYPSIAFNTF